MGLLDQLTAKGGILATAANPALARAAQQVSALPPVQTQAPRRRASIGGVLDRFLFSDDTITESLDHERARQQAIADAPRLAQQRARLEQMVAAMPASAQLAYSLNPEEFGKALSTQSEGRVLDQGDIYLQGGQPTVAAPFDAAAGSSVFDPLNPSAPISRAPSEAKVAGGALVAPDGRVLYRGPSVEGVAGTADAFLTPEIQQGQGGGSPGIVRQARPETVNLAPGGEVVTLDAQGNAVNRVGSNTAKPLSNQVRTQIREDQDAIQTSESINANLQNLIGQIDSGRLNLGPVTNLLSQGRNAAGRSDENSRNFASFRANLEKLRNDSLRLNTGVQTDGDSRRAWDELVANINDEKVVAQRLNEIMAINQRAIQYRRDRLTDAQGAVAPSAPSTPGGQIAVNPTTGARVQWNGSAWVPL